MDFYRQDVDQVQAAFKTSLNLGLTSQMVQSQKETFGPNAFQSKQKRFPLLRLLLSQCKSPLILILVVAGGVSLFIQEWADSIIIFATVTLNVSIGFVQEYKANESLKKLQSMVKLSVVAMRDGVKKNISSEEIVPGDIIFLSSGDKVPADGRIVQAKALQVNESVLTGESEAVDKHAETLQQECALADQYNMVFRGTVVSMGEAVVIVTAIGHETELGKIARLVQTTEDQDTPLQKQLAGLSKTIGIVVVLIALCIISLGFLLPGEKYSLFLLFETAIAIAVAAIPEGLAISLTIILAIGMQRILKRKALVRRLVAAETLGSVSVICTDKTGTLTQAKMRVAFFVNSKKEKIQENQIFLQAAVLSSNASLENPQADEQDWKFVGSSTEVALLHACYRSGLDAQEVRKQHERLDEIPFSSQEKYMVTLVCGERKKEKMAFLKGAPEKVLPLCSGFLDAEKSVKLTPEKREAILQIATQYAEKGYRTLALARKKTSIVKLSPADVNEFEYIGIAVIEDPLRTDVKETLVLARKAGIRVIMITGDHARTAAHIAMQLGIPHSQKNVCDGPMLETMSDEQLQANVNDIYVFARVEPKHKVRIVQALQRNGEVVAMTGDGVNDAPALKGAYIGVAVGSGTDVAKETADIVLLNDSFSTIVAAITEGRRIYQNLKKVVLYLLCGSFTEVIIIIGSIFSGLPLALLPAQILWTNIIQETFPTIALAFDKGDQENMLEPPRKKNDPIFDREMKAMITSVTLLSAGLLLLLFAYLVRNGSDLQYARTMVFSGLGVAVFFFIFSIRSMRHFVWEIPHFDNKYLNAALLMSLVLLLTAVYVPSLQNLLRITALSARDWGILCIIGALNLIVIEITKMFYLKQKRNIYS